MERGLDRLKQLTLERLEQMGVEAQPLKEMRLEVGIDVQIVYYDVHVPFAGGLNLRIPVLTTVMPRFYSPTRAQHL
jgi:hypothetical protein